MQNNNKKQSILLITDNKTIIEYFKSFFLEYNVESIIDNNFSNNSISGSEYILAIIDDYTYYKKNIEKNIKIKNIISITNEENIEYKQALNIIKLKKPLHLNNLINQTEKILNTLERGIVFKNFYILDNTLYYKEKEEKLGEKEVEIIKYLYKNNNCKKEDLLNEVWGYNSDIETKVLENTINKIKQKLKSIDIEDFIVLQDGEYTINIVYF